MSGEIGKISVFSVGWRDVADWLEQPTMIEPLYPFQRGELNSFN